MAVENTRRLAGAMSRRVQVIGAHSADFVWRAGGAVAKAVARRRRGRGDRALLRRARRVGRAVEAGGPDDRERQAHPPRRGRGRRGAPRRRRSAASTSATTRCRSTATRCWLIADAIREFAPDVLITHTDTDPFNPDHPVAYAAVDRARGAGRRRRRARARSRRSSRRSCSCSSPTSPSCATSRRPCTSTSPRCGSRRSPRWREMKAQQYLQTYYAQRGEQRGNHARRASGDAGVRYGESFQRVAPAGGGGAVSVAAELARLGAATVYEASGRAGPRRRRAAPDRARLARLRPGADRALRPGRQPDGPRRDGRRCSPARCSCSRCPSRRPVALLGDLLATQAQRARRRRGARRRRRARREELAEMGLPVWARWVRSRGATKDAVGELDVPVVVGGQRDPPGRPRRARRRRRRPSSPPSAPTRCSQASLAREAQGGRQARAAAGRARCPTSSTGCARRGSAHERDRPPRPGRAASRPRADASLAFFVDVLGMEVEARGRAGRSTCAAGATTSAGR